MSLKLAISITGDASSLKSAVAETEAAINKLGQVTTAADAKVEASAEAATAATKETSVAIEAVGAKAGVAAGNVVQLAAGLTKAERDARAAAVAVNTAGSAVEKFNRTILDQRLGVASDFGGAKRAADIAVYGAAMDDLRAKYNPLFAAGRSYKAQLDEIRQAERVGALSKAEAATAIDRTKAAFASQVVALNASRGAMAQHTAGMKLSGFQAQQLSYQLNDVFVSLASGQNPLTVAIQQGSQITPIFGGVRGTMAALAGVLNPVTIGIAAATGAVVLGAVAWNGYDASMRAVDTALTGIGRGSGATRGELEAIAQAASETANISVKAARSMETAFLRAARIGSDQFATLIAMSKNFGATIGTDAAGGAEKLASLLGDPASGARQLQQIGLLDGASARLATRLAEQNRLGEAQAVILDALPKRLADAAAATSIWARAWESVSAASSNFFDRLGQNIDRVITGPSAAEELAALQRILPSAQAGIFRGPGLDAQSVQARILELQKQLAAERLKADLNAKADANDRLSNRAIDLATQSPANADQRRLLDLQSGLTQMKDGLGKGSQETDKRLQVAAAIDAQARAIQTYLPPAEQKAKLDALDVQIQAARDPVAKARLAAERERVTMAGQVIGSIEAETRAQQARDQVIAEAMVSTQNQIADLSDETAARKAVLDQVQAGTISLADAEQQMRIELAIRPLIVAAMRLEGAARETLMQQVEGLREAYAAQAEQQKRTAALQQIAGQNDQIERLKTEIGLIGQSSVVRARVLALVEAEQKIRAAGIGGTAEAQQMRTNAMLIADQNTLLERQQAAWQAVRDTGGSAIDGLVEALGSGELSADTFTSSLKDIGKELATLSIGNPLKNALFGDNLPTITDVIGRLTGKAPAGDGIASALASTIGAMNVSAGTVIVNGGVAGTGLDRLLGGANDNGTGAGAASGNVLSFARRYVGGVNEKLTDILKEAAGRFPLKVDATSGFRAGDPRLHGGGLATDVQIYDSLGKAIPNYQSGAGFRTYEQFAQVARQVQLEKYPELTDQFRWGGYFSGPKGKYGAADAMHFDLGGRQGLGMAGGSWEGGLTSAQRSYFPDAESVGKSFDALTGATKSATASVDTLGSGFGDLASSAQSAAGGLGRLIQSVPGFGGLGAVLGGGYTSSTGWLFDGGGYTGPGAVKEPAGIVHRGEVVWSQDDIRRAGGVHVVEGMRRGFAGYAGGGAVAMRVEPARLAIMQTAATMPAARAAGGGGAASGSSAPIIKIVNNAGGAEGRYVGEQTNADGQREFLVQVDEAVSQAMDRRGGQTFQKLGQFGGRPRTTRRGG